MLQIDLFDNMHLQTDRTFINTMSENSVLDLHLEDPEGEALTEIIRSDSSTVLSVFSKRNGEYIGFFELNGLDSEPEIGINLVPAYHRKGYGFEICTEMLNYIFSVTDTDGITCKCFRENTASQRLAEKLGAVKVGEIDMRKFMQNKGLEIPDAPFEFDILVYEIRNNRK